MVDAASKMECTHCYLSLPTTYFYDHIVSSQSECAQLVALIHKGSHLESDGGYSGVGGGLPQQIQGRHEDFTLCLEEESVLVETQDCCTNGNGDEDVYRSNQNFQSTIQKMASSSRSKGIIGLGL